MVRKARRASAGHGTDTTKQPQQSLGETGRAQADEAKLNAFSSRRTPHRSKKRARRPETEHPDEWRRMRNRRSAAMSRMRKREYVAELEGQIDVLQGQLAAANEQLEQARRQIEALRGDRARAPSPSSAEAPRAHATPTPATPDASASASAATTPTKASRPTRGAQATDDDRVGVPELRLPTAAGRVEQSASPPAGQEAVTPTAFAFGEGTGEVSPCLVAPELDDPEVDVSGVVAIGLETHGGEQCAGSDANDDKPNYCEAADARRANRARTGRWQVHTAHGFQLGLEAEPEALGCRSDVAVPLPSPGPLLHMDMASAAEVLRMAWSTVATPSPHTSGRRMFFASNDVFSS